MGDVPSVSPAQKERPTARLRDPRRDSLALKMPEHIRVNAAGLPVPTPPPGVRRAPLPPGKRGLPGLGVALEFQYRPLEMITEGHGRYGPVFSTNFMGSPIIWLLGPEANEMVLSTHAANFLWRPALARVVCFLGEGMITSDGKLHDEQRALVMPALHTERVESYLHSMVNVVDSVLDTWKVGSEINIFEEMRRITLQIVARAILGLDLSHEQQALRMAFTTAGNYLDLSPPLNALRLLIPHTPWTKFLRARAIIDTLLLDVIARRRAHPGEQTDVLTTLIAARDADGTPLSDDLIRDQCMTLLVTALNEPANMMTWMQYLLDKHPEVRAKLVDENRQILGDRAPTVADLKRMPYLEMVIKETLRLYPAIWISMRLANDPFSFGGYDFHAGTFVGLSRYVSHRMPEIFADPEEFKPERFDPIHGEQHPSFAYIPFGGGPRVCPGAALAVMEGQVIMARLLRRYRLSLRPGYQTKPHVGVTLGVRGGLPMLVQAA